MAKLDGAEVQGEGPGAKRLARSAYERHAEAAEKPGGEVTWRDLALMRQAAGPEAAAELWQRVRREARDAVQGGVLVAATKNGQTPMGTAVAYALRDRFREEWQPRGGVEDALVDALAQTFMKWQFWVEAEVRWGALKNDYEWEERGEIHTLKGVLRLSDAEASEYAGRMAERSHRQFVRTLRAMQNYRRYTGNVTIHAAGPLNIAAQQQVNIGGST